MSVREAVLVFPKPKSILRRPGRLTPVNRLFVLPGGMKPKEVARVFEIAGRHGSSVPELAAGHPAAAAWRLETRREAWTTEKLPAERLERYQREQGYRLEVQSRRHRILVVSESETGLANGVKTLAQLFRRENGRTLLPPVEVVDWPDFRERGPFYESIFGTNLMGLEDWKRALEKLYLLKMNSVSVSLYNCWRRSADLEFLLFRSRKFPELKTLNQYYDHAEGRVREHYPRMYEEDFLAELVRYARELGLNFIPYFSSLGHNTYLPKAFPEVSMKDEAGRPTGYGFCTENRKTYELLFALYDEILETLKPYGITDFGLGLDEVYARCRCPECQKRPGRGMADFFIEHLVRCAGHLKSRGIKRIIFWYDILYRQGNFNDRLMEILEKEGLRRHLAVGWWCYENPDRAPDLSPRKWLFFWKVDRRLASLVNPSLCLNHLTPERELPPVSSHTDSLARLNSLGKRAGSYGVLSYSHDDPHRWDQYCCLSEFSWNQEGAGVKEFDDRFVAFLFGRRAARYEKIRDVYRRLLDTFGALTEPIHASFRYGARPPARVGQVVSAFADRCPLTPAQWRAFIAAGEKADRELQRLIAGLPEGDYRAAVADRAGQDLRRLLTTVRLAYHAMDFNRHYGYLRQGRAERRTCLAEMARQAGRLEEALAGHRALMDEIAGRRAAYHAPFVLEPMRHENETFGRYLARYRELLARLEESGQDILPTIDFYHDDFFGTDRDYRPF